MTPPDFRRALTPLVSRRAEALRRVRDERILLTEAKRKLADCTLAREVVQEVAQTVQNEAHRKIASVVSRCLQLVFGDLYGFKIHFDKKRGKTEARMVFTRGAREFDPASSAGGGVIDVAAFALRLAALVLSRPPKRRLLVLDEPFAHLSSSYRPQVADMLLAVAKDLGVQVVMVTHSEELEIGKVVRV